MELKLTDKIEHLNGIGTRRCALYKKLGIDTIYDLLTFYPRDYLDFSDPVPIMETILNEQNVIRATVYKKQGEQRIRKGLSIFRVFVTDSKGSLTITIFNSKYMFDSLKENQEYFFYGKVTGTLLRREMTSPLFVNTNEEKLIRPIYNLTQGLSNKLIQNNVKDALDVWGDRLSDDIPSDIRQQYKLCQLRYAIENIHYPTDINALDIARKRLIFEELLIFQLGLLLLRKKRKTETGIQLNDTDISEFEDSLPFKLTAGQKQSVAEGLADMKKNVPMNRLLQGDVGSGKTMVAAALCFACHKNGFQSAIMAPTQILAEQHFDTFKQQLAPLGVNCCLITGSQTAKQRTALTDGIKNGKYSVVIGTHALISKDVEFKSLGLVITDEQHRFGVAQRATLTKKGNNPHLLVMSATPIPRTLALIIYGDLDISVIHELPKGRHPIETFTINSGKRTRALNFIKKNIDEGRQAYIVCPLINENDNDIISIEEYITALKKTPLASYKTAALHGKLKPKEKEGLMKAFQQKEIQILVSTTVIEVGIDVPNANIMLIENAERFGLSQLHQLRGRVGRGQYKSCCILISDHMGEENRRRLKIMKSTSDGFQIAQEDLKLRGPGDFFGFRQHGLPTLKIANLLHDIDTLKQTQKVAQTILKTDETLSSADNRGLRVIIKRLFAQNDQISLN